MDISEANFKIVNGLMERAAERRPDASFMALRETEDSADWWKLGERIKVPSLLFRIATIFNRFRGFFPAEWQRWYVNQVKDVYHKYCKSFVEKLSEEEKSYYRRIPVKGMSPGLYAQVKLNAQVWLAFKGDKVVNPAKPNEFAPDKTIVELAKRFHYRNMFRKIKRDYAPLLDAHTVSALNKHLATLKHFPGQLPKDYCDALAHIEAVVLSIEGNESDEEISLVLRLLLKMTVMGVSQESLDDYMEWYGMPKPENRGSSARIITKSSWHGSRASRRLAYETDAVLGYDGVPPTFTLDKDRAVLQKFIASAEDLDTYLGKDPGAAQKLGRMNLAVVHAHQTFGLLQGRADGLGKHTLVETREDAPVRLYDIDEQENFLPKNMDIEVHSADEGSRVGVLAVLGLPQGAKPYSKLMLKVFAWDGLKSRVLKQFDQRALNHKNRKAFFLRRQALVERLEKITEVCRFESEKETPTLTPRDLYFLISGKDWVYQQFKLKGYSDYEFFNGGMCRCDDIPVKAKKEVTDPSLFARNLTALGSSAPEEDKYWRTAVNKTEKEQYLGDRVLSRANHQLFIDRTVDSCEIPEGGFDEEGWNRYKSFCQRTQRPVRSFMLSYFLKGFAKRMARQFVVDFPFCSLDVGTNDRGKFLQITKSRSAVRVDDEIEALGTSNGRCKVAIVDKKDLFINRKDYEEWARHKILDLDVPRMKNSVRGPQHHLLQRVFKQYIQLRPEKRQYEICETKKTYEIYFVQSAFTPDDADDDQL